LDRNHLVGIIHGVLLIIFIQVLLIYGFSDTKLQYGQSVFVIYSLITAILFEVIIQWCYKSQYEDFIYPYIH